MYHPVIEGSQYANALLDGAWIDVHTGHAGYPSINVMLSYCRPA
jgi:hypothetical protein